MTTEPAPAPELVTEQDLAADVLDALLRENFAGLSDRVDPDGPDGAALLLPGSPRSRWSLTAS